MCLHATWLPEAQCTRCTPPRRIKVEVIRRESPLPPRTSTLKSTYIPQVNRPLPEVAGVHCVGCDRTILNPGMCRTGSVLTDPVFSTILKKVTLPVIVGSGSVTSHVPPATRYTFDIHGMHTSLREKKVSFRMRRKGTLCETCSSCIVMVPLANGDREPLVITDPSPSYHDLNKGSLEVGFDSRPPRRKILNTRTTQGRRGRRV